MSREAGPRGAFTTRPAGRPGGGAKGGREGERVFLEVGVSTYASSSILELLHFEIASKHSMSAKNVVADWDLRKVLKFKKGTTTPKEEEEGRSDTEMSTEAPPAGIDVVSLPFHVVFV